MSASKLRNHGSRRIAGLSHTLGRERGFTIVELGIVVTIISIMLFAAIISYYSATRRTEVMGAAEQVKQELRKVYAMADSGTKTNGMRDQYRITFHNNGENPPNAYLVEKGTWTGAAYNWVAVAPTRGAANKIVSTNWVQPANQADCQLIYSGTGIITFASKGSIVEVTPAADNTITVGSVSQGKNIIITVNSAGSIDSTQ